MHARAWRGIYLLCDYLFNLKEKQQRARQKRNTPDYSQHKHAPPTASFEIQHERRARRNQIMVLGIRIK